MSRPPCPPDAQTVLLLQGPVLYAHYGEEGDLEMLRNKNLDLSGRVLLVRAGRNSFAQKVGGVPAPWPLRRRLPADLGLLSQVANAARLNASAVLVYPDPADYSLQDNVELFGHVRLCLGVVVEAVCWIKAGLCDPPAGPPGLRGSLHTRISLL